MQAYDLVVVGGGIVGLTQALALQHSGLSVAVIDANPSQAWPSGEPQLRVSALTLASETIFRNLDVWQHVDNERLTAYQDMYVWEQDSFAKIEFNAQQVKQQQLGFIVENQNLRHALWQAAELAENIDIITANLTNLQTGQQECFITLDNQSQLSARLVIGADGANSKVKKLANFAHTFWDYEQNAIVATVKTAEPHHNVARQVFTPTGPLAFLPLWDKHVCSIVWSQDNQQAQKLMAMPEATFNQALTTAFDCRLGLCQVISQKHSFPLKMQYVRQWVTDRVAIIGDAAHTIHPLAGQGANLGIADAAALAEQIIQKLKQDKDFGLAKNLRPFERWRKTECSQMLTTMETLKRLFAGKNSAKKLLRGTGLSWVNQSSFAKQHIIQHAMGLNGELPKLAKGLKQELQ